MYGNLPHSVALVCHAWVGSQGHSEVHGQQCSAVVFQCVGSEGDELGCQIVVSVLTQGGDDGVPFLIEQRNVERHAVVESCGVAESLHVLPYGVVVVVADDGADIVLPAGVKGVSQACPPLFLLVVHGVGSDTGLEIAFGSEGTFDAPSGVFRKVGIIDYRRLADSVHETVETPCAVGAGKAVDAHGNLYEVQPAGIRFLTHMHTVVRALYRLVGRFHADACEHMVSFRYETYRRTGCDECENDDSGQQDGTKFQGDSGF